jgi:hypothetical protein
MGSPRAYLGRIRVTPYGIVRIGVSSFGSKEVSYDCSFV